MTYGAALSACRSEEKPVRKCLIAGSVFAVCLAAAIAAVGASEHPDGSRSSHYLAVDGGFRDGLYLGRLTAKQGRPNQPPVGRWSNKSDRDSFLAGYRQAYQAASVSGVSATARR